MTDLATLGIRIQSQEADVAEKRLDELAASAARAEKGVDDLAIAARRADGATATMNVAVKEQNRVLNLARNSIGLTTAESLNLSRQFADIGVTAAMGMNPLMIALQQGPQLLDIFQMAAIRTEVSVRTAMVATGAAIWTAFAPLIPVIAAVAAAAAIALGGFALGAREAEKELGSVRESLSLTDAELKKLKDSGVDTGVTMGDVFRGVGTTIKEGFFDLFRDQIDDIDRVWNGFLDDAWQVYVKAQKGITGATFVAFYVIRDTWRMLPGVVGDAAISAANAVVGAVEWMANKAREFFNTMLRGAKAVAAINPAMGWVNGIKEIEAFNFAGLANPWAGQMRAFGASAARSAAQGWEDASGFIDRQMDRLLANIGASRDARVLRGLGDRSKPDAAGPSRSREGSSLVEELEALPRIDLQPLRVQVVELVEPLKLIADEIRLIDGLAQETAQGLTSAFGETGRALGTLLTSMTRYQSRIAEINLAEKEYHLSAAQAERERAYAQVANYGDMLAAAKGFFREGSDGYRVLQAAEAAYRVFQFAMSVQAMAQNAAETSASVAGSAAKGTASAAAGAAKMFEALGPFGFPVVAAMIALLASLGLKGKGGGGGSSSPSLDGSVAKSQGYSQQADATQSAFAASVAQKVEVRVTADRDGLNAYVAQTAREEATPLVMQGMAAASGATRAQVMSDLDKGRTYSRGG